MHIEPRSAWGAAPPKAPGKPWAPSGPIDLVVHWVGGSGSIGITSHADCPTRIKAIQTYEMSKEYSDIAYNLICCPHGTVYEGRGLNVQGAANGPQTNATKPSVCLLLNMADRMTPAMQDRILDLNRWVTPGTILGHREVNTTTCPGDEVYAWITTHRHANPIPPVPAPETDIPATNPVVLGTVTFFVPLVIDTPEVKLPPAVAADEDHRGTCRHPSRLPAIR